MRVYFISRVVKVVGAVGTAATEIKALLRPDCASMLGFGSTSSAGLPQCW